MEEQTKTFYELEVERIIRDSPLPEYYYVYVRQSKSFMENHYAEKIGLETIAASAFMSRFHFIRVFQLVYGMTPRQYLRDLRIGKAKELLKKGYGVSEVCFEIGYESVPTFSKVFKLGTGQSPKAYRESEH